MHRHHLIVIALAASSALAACGSVSGDPEGAVDELSLDEVSTDDELAGLRLRRRQTGIWYSTWYTNKGHYRWASGVGRGSSKQFVADVNGDGYDDAVAFSAATGSWSVALSNGSVFGAAATWATGLGIGSQNQFIADVNGDGRPDAVMYFADGGRWYVGLSNGASTFLYFGYAELGRGIGVGSTTQFMADVNGDRRADAVTFDAATGAWNVALSAAADTRLLAPVRWAVGLGIGSTARFLADVDGNRQADAVLYFAATGQWYVGHADARRAIFGAFGPVEANHQFGKGSTAQAVVDVDDDGKADAVAFCGSEAPCGSASSTVTEPGTWYVARSNGSAFLSPAGASAAQHGHAPGFGNVFRRTAEADAILFGDVRGVSGRDPIIFTADDGSWWAHRWDAFFPSALNAWEWSAFRHLPRLASGKYGTYDSSDAREIDYHLDLIHGAAIDFLLFDETNMLDFKTYIKEGAEAVCARIAAKRAADATYPRYAIAIGKIQFTHDPADLEYEAEQVWNDFVTSSRCGGAGNYATHQGKPLLVVHALTTDREAWTRWGGDKTASNRFTIKWSTAVVGPTLLEGCTSIGGVPPSSVSTVEDGTWLGWASLDRAGLRSHPDGMFVQPGWNQQVYCPTVSREGTRRYEDDWAAALAVNPAILTIASFNDYSEETAVAPTDTRLVQGTSEKWSSPDAYWDITVVNNRALRRR